MKKKMLKIGMFMTVYFLSVHLIAQTIISPLWVDRGIILRDQLWNLSIISAQALPYTGKVEMTVYDASTGGQIFSALSKEITINKGSTIITPLAAYPVNYSVFSASYNYNPAVNTILPPGIFNICYKLYSITYESGGVTGEECKVLESDPLSPPTLILPENNSEINTGSPFFTWLPPVPNNTLPLLNYRIRVVEKGAQQSSQEAVERNIPIFSATRIPQNSSSYPNNIQKLDTGKTYAWQVLAYNDNSYVGASECWSFKLKNDTGSVSNKNFAFYVPLIKAGSSQVVMIERELKFSYNNEANDSSVVVRINRQINHSDLTGEDFQYDVPLKGGVNYININLDDFPKVKENIIYEMHLINRRGERWWIDFKQKPGAY